MSYPWFAGAPSSVSALENSGQNGSLTHSPATVSGGTDSPGTSSHPASGAAGSFPSTSPYSALNTATSQHSSESHSQSPHGVSHSNPSSFLPSLAENSLQQHLYSASSRFGPFSGEGVSSSEQNFPFGMSPQMLSQSYSMRSQAYAGMPGYSDSSQQDMSRLNAYSTSAYSAPGLESYYNPFDSRSVPGASQSSEAMFSATERLMKADPYENGVPRPPTNPWSQFGADGRDGLYLQPGYTSHPMSPYGSALGHMFHPNAHFRSMGYDGSPFKSDMSDPYGLASSAVGPRFSPPQMMFNRDKKSPKKPDSSPIPKPATNVDDSPPVPNKAAKYFSERGIFVFHPPDTGPAVGPYASMMMSMADRYIMCQKMLCQRLSDVDLPPKVTYVYNPLEYAFETHYKFVKKYYNSSKRILFLGMNPGPFGMSQNGVPFGECNIVTDWMDIDGEVSKPVLEHPKRPVMGMECKRSEVSGARFWELFRRLCPTAEGFFKNCAIHNLCPLAFMTETGKNVAPSDMPVKVLRQLDSLCDQTFLDVVALFKVEHVITIGKYAYTCAQKAMTSHNVHGVQLHCMMHPSPANPSANKGWADIAENQLREFGVYNIIAVNPQPPPSPPSACPPASAAAATTTPAAAVAPTSPSAPTPLTPAPLASATAPRATSTHAPPTPTPPPGGRPSGPPPRQCPRVPCLPVRASDAPPPHAHPPGCPPQRSLPPGPFSALPCTPRSAEHRGHDPCVHGDGRGGHDGGGQEDSRPGRRQQPQPQTLQAGGGVSEGLKPPVHSPCLPSPFLLFHGYRAQKGVGVTCPLPLPPPLVFCRP